jgi:uncharacterized OsmC-like protein
MTTATATIDVPAKKKAPPVPRHGVDTPVLLATINAVAGQPELAKFQFRAKTQWIKGTHCRTTIADFSGAGGEHRHMSDTVADADHPAVLCGADQGPTPVEWLLHALATCIMAGMANIAAARGVTLKRAEATISGNMDLRGILGISNDVRNGYESIALSIEIEGDAPVAKLREIVEQARARSAVYDMLTNGLPVVINAKPLG